MDNMFIELTSKNGRKFCLNSEFITEFSESENLEKGNVRIQIQQGAQNSVCHAMEKYSLFRQLFSVRYQPLKSLKKAKKKTKRS